MPIPTTPSPRRTSPRRSSPRTNKTQQTQVSQDLRAQISQALFLGDNEHAQLLYYDLLHPSRAPFDWRDVHDYANFLLNHQHLPMRAFRVLRKCELLEHTVAGFLAVEALVRMARMEEGEEEQRAKLTEALELLMRLSFQPSSVKREDNFVKREDNYVKREDNYVKREDQFVKREDWEGRRDRLEQSIRQKLKLDNTTTQLSSTSPFTKDWSKVREKFYARDYQAVLELGNVYGASPVAIPNEFLPPYLYALYVVGQRDELFSLAQWLVDEQGHLPYAWYAVALYYKLLPAAAGSERVKRFLLKAVSKDGTFVEAWLALGELYSGRTGDHDLAVRALKQAAVNAQVQHRTDALEWATLQLVGEYLRVKKPKEALLTMNSKSMNSDAMNSDATDLMSNERAVAAYQMGDVREAFDILHTLVRTSHLDPVLINYAAVCIKLSKFGPARAALSQVKERKRPSFLRLHAFVHEMLGMSGLDPEMLAIALDSYSVLLLLDPQDVFSKDASAKTLLLYKYLSKAPFEQHDEESKSSDAMEMETD